MKLGYRTLLAWAFLAFALFGSRTVLADCVEGNVLAHRPPHGSRGTQFPERITNDVLAPEGEDAKSKWSATMKGVLPFVEWDLGEPTPIVAAAVQADNNDPYMLLGSVDGKVYAPLWDVPKVGDGGLRERITRDLRTTARFVRFQVQGGDQIFAAAEVRLYCRMPVVWPPSRVVRSPPPEPGSSGHFEQTHSMKMLLALLAFPLLFVVVPRLRRRARRGVLAAFFVMAAACWFQFGYFTGSGLLHGWDFFHYFMGSKYFPEVGYFDFYKCAAKGERENGNTKDVDATPIRDLENSQINPGDWTRTAEGACSARFTAERWKTYRADLAQFEQILPLSGKTVAKTFTDHGFNATPVNMVWLRLFSSHLTPTFRSCAWLANIDTVALVTVVAAVGWGFGAITAVVVALVISVGAFWNFQWVGGSFSRMTWLALFAVGFSALKREKPLTAGVFLTLAGLLRLFPFVFVGAVGIKGLVELVQTRALSRWFRRFLVGAGITFAIGVGTAAALEGPGSFVAFRHVMSRHSRTPATNELGLSSVLSYMAGQSAEKLSDSRLSDPYEVWTKVQLARRDYHRPLWLLALTLSLGALVLSAARGATPNECLALGGLLVFVLLPMTSYDYPWIICLVGFADRKPQILRRLVAFVLMTEVLFVFSSDADEIQHLVTSIVLAVLLASLVEWRKLFDAIVDKLAPREPSL